MFNLFKRNKSNINSIVIPDFGWEQEKNDKNVKQWFNPEQAIVLSINYFNSKPDLPSLKEINAVRYFYREQITEHNGGLIEVDFTKWKNTQALRTLFKIPQTPSGTVYLASLTIPFHDCSYVIKVQAPELGMTGIRETVITDRLIQSGEIRKTANGYKNWQSDPYNANFNKGTLMNKSEDSKYDHEFSDHPLSQARKLISQIEKEIEFQPEISELKAYRK